MGTRQELGLQIGDRATALTASFVRPEVVQVVSPVPDTEWDLTAVHSGYDTRIKYEATLFKVTSVDEWDTHGEIIATTKNEQGPGEPVRIHSAFTGYVGGRGERTYEGLRAVGVEIHEEIATAPDGTETTTGLQIVQPWRTLEEFYLRPKDTVRKRALKSGRRPGDPEVEEALRKQWVTEDTQEETSSSPHDTSITLVTNDGATEVEGGKIFTAPSTSVEQIP